MCPALCFVRVLRFVLFASEGLFMLRGLVHIVLFLCFIVMLLCLGISALLIEMCSDLLEEAV